MKKLAPPRPAFGSPEWHAERKALMARLAAKSRARGFTYTPQQIEQSRRALHMATYGTMDGYAAYPEAARPRMSGTTFAARSAPDADE